MSNRTETPQNTRIRVVCLRATGRKANVKEVEGLPDGVTISQCRWPQVRPPRAFNTYKWFAFYADLRRDTRRGGTYIVENLLNFHLPTGANA